MAAGGLLPQSKPAPPRAAGGSIMGPACFCAGVALTIAVAAVVAMFVTRVERSDEPGHHHRHLPAAFFPRVMC